LKIGFLKALTSCRPFQVGSVTLFDDVKVVRELFLVIDAADFGLYLD
jgi:hypothetical protein